MSHAHAAARWWWCACGCVTEIPDHVQHGISANGVVAVLGQNAAVGRAAEAEVLVEYVEY